MDGERGLKNGDGGADDAAAVGDDGGEVIRSDTWHGGGKPTKHKNTSRVIFGPPITPRRLSSVVSHAYWYLVSKARGSREGVHTLQRFGKPFFLAQPDGCGSTTANPLCPVSQVFLIVTDAPLPTSSLGRLARAPLPADPTDVRDVAQGGDEDAVPSRSAATGDDTGDAAKKPLVGLAGCAALLLASQADAAVAVTGNDDSDAGLLSRPTGGGECLARDGDLHLFCGLATTVSALGLPSAVAGCPTHLLVAA